jgi:hypothetical protein
MSFKRFLLIGAITAAVSGCNTIGRDDLGFGESVKYDTALQTINPVPVYPPNAAQPGDNGDKGAQAVKRYRSDEVKPVEQMQTTTGTGGSSGTSSGSSPQ